MPKEGLEPSPEQADRHKSGEKRDRGPDAPATDSDAKCPTRHEPVTGCDSSVDVVEAALAGALERAAAAGQWTVVEVLARELEARRRAWDGVVDLDAARARRRR